MKLSVLNHKVGYRYNPEDSYLLMRGGNYSYQLDEQAKILGKLKGPPSKGIMLITMDVYPNYNKLISGVVTSPTKVTDLLFPDKPTYMLVGEGELQEVESAMLVGKWAGVVLNNLDSNMLERDYPRKLVKSLINIGKTVFIMGLQYPRQALWIHRQYNGKVAGVFSSLPVVYGRLGVAFHPHANPMFDLPENEAVDNSSGHYDAIIHWNVRCMEAWTQGVELIPPGWLQ